MGVDDKEIGMAMSFGALGPWLVVEGLGLKAEIAPKSALQPPILNLKTLKT